MATRRKPARRADGTFARKSRPNKAPRSAKRVARPKKKACSTAARTLKITKGTAARSRRRQSLAAQTTRACGRKARVLADAAARRRNAKRRAAYAKSKKR